MQRKFIITQSVRILNVGEIGTLNEQLQIEFNCSLGGGIKKFDLSEILNYVVEFNPNSIIESGDTIVVIGNHLDNKGKIYTGSAVYVRHGAISVCDSPYHKDNVAKVVNQRRFFNVTTKKIENFESLNSIELENRNNILSGDTIIYIGECTDGLYLSAIHKDFYVVTGGFGLMNHPNYDLIKYANMYRAIKKTIAGRALIELTHQNCDHYALNGIKSNKEVKMKDLKVTEVELCGISQTSLEKHAGEFAKVLKFTEAEYNDGVVYFYQTEDYSQGDGWNSAKVKHELEVSILQNKDENVLNFCISHCLIRSIRFAKVGATVSEMLHG